MAAPRTFSVVVGRAGRTERTEAFTRFPAARRFFHAEAGRVISDIEAFVLLGLDHPPAPGGDGARGSTVLAAKSNGHRWVELSAGYYRGGKVQR